MTFLEAQANIGKQFKYELFHKFDTIRDLTDDHYIVGDFGWFPVEQCRLKEEQPEQLKTKNVNLCPLCGYEFNSMGHIFSCQSS